MCNQEQEKSSEELHKVNPVEVGVLIRMLESVSIGRDQASATVSEKKNKLKSLNLHLDKVLNHNNILMKKLMKIDAQESQVYEK